MKSISGILANVNLITNNYKLKRYIENCIVLNDGELRIDLKSSNQCDYLFKNINNENVYINLVKDSIYVYVSNKNGREELTYNKTSDGINVTFNSFRKYSNIGGLQVIQVTEEKTCYDVSGLLVSHNCHVDENTFLNGEIIDNLMYTNYDKDISDYFLDGELVRFENVNYQFYPELSRSLCYVSDFESGMFCSGDDSKLVCARYVPFIGDFSEYVSKIEKNNSKILKI